MARTARLVDLDGTEILALTSETPSDDPIFVSKLTKGFPDVREVSEPSPGQDGANDTTALTGAAAVVLEGTIVGTSTEPAPVWAARFAPLLHPGRRCYLYAQAPGWPEERRILLRGVSFDAPLEASTDIGFQASWKAPAGVWESAAERSVSVYANNGASGGAVLPYVLPVTLTPGGVPGSARISVSPDALPTAPLIRIYGPCTDPQVQLDPGDVIAFTGITVDRGSYLEVDMAGHTVLLNGDPDQSRWRYRLRSVWAWWRIPPGDSQISFSAAAAGSGCHADVIWRDRQP